MSGWPAVALIIFGQIVAAAFLVRLAARRWWEYLAISLLTMALVRPTARYVTGDVSRYLPDAIWSDNGDKEQIIYVSAASTVLLPLMVSALLVYCFRQIRRTS